MFRKRLSFLFALFFILALFSCQSSKQVEKVPTRGLKRLIAVVTCRFDNSDTLYLCSAYKLPSPTEITDIYELVIAKDSTNGKIVFSRNYYPESPDSEGQQDNILGLTVEYNGSYNYLVVVGTVGNGVLTRFLAKKNGRFQQLAEFERVRVEFADVDNDETDEVLVPEDKFRPDLGVFPDVNIYKWQGWELKLLRTVPYKKRLCEH